MVIFDGFCAESEVADGIDPHEVFLEEPVDQTVQELPVRLPAHRHRAEPEESKSVKNDLSCLNLSDSNSGIRTFDLDEQILFYQLWHLTS